MLHLYLSILLYFIKLLNHNVKKNYNNTLNKKFKNNEIFHSNIGCRFQNKKSVIKNGIFLQILIGIRRVIRNINFRIIEKYLNHFFPYFFAVFKISPNSCRAEVVALLNSLIK